MSHECQCHCNFSQTFQQMLYRLVFPSGLMPLVPEQFRTYPSAIKTPATDGPGVFTNAFFWNTDDDYYNSE